MPHEDGFGLTFVSFGYVAHDADCSTADLVLHSEIFSKCLPLRQSVHVSRQLAGSFPGFDLFERLDRAHINKNVVFPGNMNQLATCDPRLVTCDLRPATSYSSMKLERIGAYCLAILMLGFARKAYCLWTAESIVRRRPTTRGYIEALTWNPGFRSLPRDSGR